MTDTNTKTKNEENSNVYSFYLTAFASILFGAIIGASCALAYVVYNDPSRLAPLNNFVINVPKIVKNFFTCQPCYSGINLYQELANDVSITHSTEIVGTTTHPEG